ncbi:MAG: hypothetical protein AB7Q16_00295 [Vicinamibacterales bacterium]
MNLPLLSRHVAATLESDEWRNLSRALSDLLVELSVAVHKHAMYPRRHPALASVAGAVLLRTAPLFADREQIAIGVARRQLMIEGVATDPSHPVLSRLAECLHAHHLGAISLLRGLQADELGDLLHLLAVEPEQGGAIGLVPADQRPSWPHLRLHPLAFDRLAIVASDADGAPDSERCWQGGELWLGLAQAALAGPQPEVDPREAGPEALARAIDARAGAEAYDQVIAGYLLQIAQALRTASGAEVDALRARTSQLIAALQPETLRRLVRTSRSESGPHEFVRDAAQGLHVDAVLEVLKATADVAGETISHGLIRMLTKLAANAGGRDPAVSLAADDALRAQVVRLLADWRLADPNPESYARLLQHLATSDQGGADTDGADADPSFRVVQMALELGDMGPQVQKVVARQIERGAIGALVGLVAKAPQEGKAAAAALHAQLTATSTLERLLAEEPIDFATLDILLPSLPVASCEPLLDSLANSTSRVTRRRLLDRLADAPQDLSPFIVARLSDSRWFVQRNMLLLFERRRSVPEGFSMAPCLSHADWRVRYEAVRLVLTHPGPQDAVLRLALGDDQPRIVGLALGALRQSCPADLVGPVAAIATNPSWPEETRLLAAAALGASRQPAALDALVAMVDGGRTLLGRSRLAKASPLCLAALRAMARHFSGNRAAEPYLKLARSSPINDVRSAVATETP